jgi:hypothetical protein
MRVVVGITVVGHWIYIESRAADVLDVRRQRMRHAR